MKTIFWQLKNQPPLKHILALPIWGQIQMYIFSATAIYFYFRQNKLSNTFWILKIEVKNALFQYHSHYNTKVRNFPWNFCEISVNLGEISVNLGEIFVNFLWNFHEFRWYFCAFSVKFLCILSEFSVNFQWNFREFFWIFREFWCNFCDFLWFTVNSYEM